MSYACIEDIPILAVLPQKDHHEGVKTINFCILPHCKIMNAIIVPLVFFYFDISMPNKYSCHVGGHCKFSDIDDHTRGKYMTVNPVADSQDHFTKGNTNLRLQESPVYADLCTARNQGTSVAEDDLQIGHNFFPGIHTFFDGKCKFVLIHFLGLVRDCANP